MNKFFLFNYDSNNGSEGKEVCFGSLEDAKEYMETGLFESFVELLDWNRLKEEEVKISCLSEILRCLEEC